MIAAISARYLLAVCGRLRLATSVRACDLRTSVCDGELQRGQTSEAERWCRVAWTANVNQALTPEGQRAARVKGSVAEHQSSVPPQQRGPA